MPAPALACSTWALFSWALLVSPGSQAPAWEPSYATLTSSGALPSASVAGEFPS